MNETKFSSGDYKLTEYRLTKKYPNAETKSAWRKNLLNSALERKRPRVFGEGDSWFDFPFPLNDSDNSDILDVLLSRYDYALARASKKGDTLENMCREENIANLVTLCKEHRARAFLFSGGGNDLVDGDPNKDSQFYLLLNNKADGVPPVDAQELKAFLIHIEVLIRRMVDGISRLGISTLMAGYGYAIPSGIAAFCKPLKCFGPWLEPALEARGYFDNNEQRKIVDEIINEFNKMLKNIGATRNDFIYINLRPVINDVHWRDEFHLTPDGFNKAAEEFHNALQPII